MLEFLQQYWSSILVIIGFIGVCVVLIKNGYKRKVEDMLFYLVCKAEELLGNGTGELKYSAVVAWLYEKLPTIIQVIFTKKEIDQMIEAAVQRMKDYLKNNYYAYSRICSLDEHERRGDI